MSVPTLLPPGGWTPVTFGRDPLAYRFTVAQYDRMVELNILTTEDKVELLAGYLVMKEPASSWYDCRTAFAWRTPVTYGEPSAYRFTVEQYDRLIDANILTTEDKVELLDGYLVTIMPPNPPHSSRVAIAAKRIDRLLPPGWTSRVQDVIVLSMSQPQPDVAVARGSDTDYMTSHPSAADVGLLIEVSDSSLALDHKDKLPIYAGNGIPVFWIVNIPDQCIEVYEQPSGPSPTPGFAVTTVYRIGDSAPDVLDGINVGSVAVADLFP